MTPSPVIFVMLLLADTLLLFPILFCFFRGARLVLHPRLSVFCFFYLPVTFHHWLLFLLPAIFRPACVFCRNEQGREVLFFFYLFIFYSFPCCYTLLLPNTLPNLLLDSISSKCEGRKQDVIARWNWKGTKRITSNTSQKVFSCKYLCVCHLLRAPPLSLAH